MANATDVWITSLQGTDPQNLMPYITRQHIYDCRFWKEECFGLTVSTVLSKAAAVLQCVGGTFGPNLQPTKFICLVLKLLQLQPEVDVVVEGFIQQDEFKYVRALGCFYLRLTALQGGAANARPYQVYEQLEPLYRDFRKLRMRLTSCWSIVHMDEFIHQLLTQETCCGLTIPRLPLRHVLVQQGYLEGSIRRSALHDVVVTQFQTKQNSANYASDLKHSGNEGEDDNEDNDDEDVTIDELVLMAYLQHKAEQENCVAAQVLWQSRLQTKELLSSQHEDGSYHNTSSSNHDEDLKSRHPSNTVLSTNDSDNHLGDRIRHNEEDPAWANNNNDQQAANHPDYKVTTPTLSSSSLHDDIPSSSHLKQHKKQHKDAQTRKYDNLFKKSKSERTVRTTGHDETSGMKGGNAPTTELSEDYWNEERAKLGLKPLKK